MNSALTRPQSLQELYKTYFSFANKFHFTDLLRNYIQNEEWKDKSQEPVWNLLSKISDDIGAVLTDDIVNYTRNVVDVNTCKLPELIEHAQMLSYRLDHLKNSYAFFPKRIQCLVDIFSINPEYLLGNHKNHILSDTVIKEILVYIRENVKDRTIFTNEDVIDKLIENPHGLMDYQTYYNFIQTLFYVSIVQALSTTYSETDTQPMAFNLLWKERQNQQNILSRLDEYKSWIDKYIWNEIEYPLNDDGLSNTVYSLVEQVKNQKQMSSKFNPFKIADHIYFNGLNPTHGLSDDELGLVETVLDYHSKTKYNYESQQFVADVSTQYAYYKELEFCEYVKLVMFIVNNIKSFDMTGLTYDISSNKFIQTGQSASDCLRVVRIFNEGNHIVENGSGKVALNHKLILRVAKFLCDYVFHVQALRENMKTIAQKHAMRGSGALLVHIVNDYLIKELPNVRDMMYEGVTDEAIQFMWEYDAQFRNYGNVKILEYEDDNEYFNIEPSKDVRFTERTNERYWEQLEGMSDDDTLGVLTKGQIKNFYRNVLNMGILQKSKPMDYDDICDFLVDLFKVGANPVEWHSEDEEFYNPIDDIINKSEKDYGYSKLERLEVQNNTELRKNQEEQFMEYSGNEDIVGQSIYDLVNNKIFYWKNTDYSSHALHPFMYNLKLWNKLNNIIINGYKDYVNTDLIDYMSSQVKFDEIFGPFGEGRNFWKYNITDFTGYTTRYEAAVKDEHIDDFNNTVSKLTGYDGLFYPNSAKDFLLLFGKGLDGDGKEIEEYFKLPEWFFVNNLDTKQSVKDAYFKDHEFVSAIYSVYWQIKEMDGGHPFYTQWYSHLNYTRTEYQKIAMQLWYWRKRIYELISTEYPITKYVLDIQGNSLILVQTFKPDEDESNPYLIDLAIAQNEIQQNRSGNQNTHVSFCDNKLKRPSELWIRWKSNPIALPAFDVYYDRKTGDDWFDFYYRTKMSIEMGQLTHTNNDCNENFKLVLTKWRNEYENMIVGNKLPVFFDMEQSANILALASWYIIPYIDSDGIVHRDSNGEQLYVTCCAKNPLHILSIERTSSEVSEYNLTHYDSSQVFNGIDILLNWMFDAYHYCQANGALLIPLYSFDCADSWGEQVPEEEREFRQFVNLRMFTVPAQTLKQDNYVANSRLVQLKDIRVDLNQKVDFNDENSKYRFDHPIKVCRNTNLVFSAYDLNGLNRVKCAFLGTFVKDEDSPYLEADNYTNTSFKVSSCEAKTRYEYDSQSTTDLALTKGRVYTNNTPESLNIDSYVDTECFNSYDSMDKYVFVLDFEPSIDQDTMFNLSALAGLTTYSYNILSDAGFIPHFAYQSLIRYDDSDRDCGTAYTWRNKYLARKNHMQFELLGIDDKRIPDAFEIMRKMVVEDLTDDCKTLLSPARFMDDIYRIWCETRGMKRRVRPGEKEDEYESYFKNEYVDYTNPEIDFTGIVPVDGWRKYDWEIDPTRDGDFFELDLPVSEQYIDDMIDGPEKEQARIDAFKVLLDDYYVSVVRTEQGEILNEKRYILPPTSLSEFILGMGEEDNDGFMKCNLSPYQSALVQDDHFVPTQVMFVGTTNPFAYDENGNRIYSKPEELQYGNSLVGVDEIELKIDIISVDDDYALKYDETGNVVLIKNEPYGRDEPDYRTVVRKYVKPTLRFKKRAELDSTASGLLDRTQMLSEKIPYGEVTIILSHKNLDNIAKYHILNRSSNLYFQGSLPKNNKNEFKFSDFKFSRSVDLVQTGTTWKSRQLDSEGNPILQFSLSNVKGSYSSDDSSTLLDLPPYYVEVGGKKWYLEQDKLHDSGNDKTFKKGDKTYFCDHPSDKCHIASMENGYHQQYTKIPIPSKGDFRWAHEMKSKPERYLDYLYINNGGLSFKVSEESQSFADAMSKIPPFYVDVVTRNKLDDLNDVQVLKEYSTFIHQSENPDDVKNCRNFNPLFTDVVLNYGIEQKELYTGFDTDGITPLDVISQDDPPQMICIEKNKYEWPASYTDWGFSYVPAKNTELSDVQRKVIELSNTSGTTRLDLQLEDGEIDDYLKIYTNYVRVDDGFGDWHYDLYFNIQNLLHSPFEYISTVTGQPNVLILEDSYLYLSGDKFKKVYEGGEWTHNEIDDNKVDKIKEGGVLTIYGQVKTYSNDKLSDVRTIKLFSYRVYNVSDDKPKFLIDKTYDITKSTIENDVNHKITIEFSDVMWTVDEKSFKRDEIDKFRVLNEDITVVQPVKIRYNWDPDDDYRIKKISFDIMHDIIDFNYVPELCEYWIQARTLRNGESSPMDKIHFNGTGGNVVGKPYYDHWSDRYMKLEFDEATNTPRMTLMYDALNGYNFETIYLRWKLPRNCKLMDTLDRLGGYVFSSMADNIVVETSNTNVSIPKFNVITGHVVTRVHKPGTMYLGLEHSTTRRKNGYVLKGLATAIADALDRGEKNPTLETLAITEKEILDEAKITRGE